MHEEFITLDGYQVKTWVYNTGDYATHVFIANRQNTTVNSTNHVLHHLKGKDSYECLMKEGRMITKAHLIRMFFEG